MSLLEIRDLKTSFRSDEGLVRAVDGIDLDVAEGEVVGVVGESGSGKSVTVQAVMGLIHVPGEIKGGDIRWKGRTFLDPLGRAYLAEVRGKEIAMIFQDR